jgi:predicted RND superfamily exporter protein
MLAIAVATWAWSPIKFQADMGILLAFMFVLNMVGALVLLPAIGLFIMPKKESANTAAAQSPKRWQEGMEVRR